MRRSYKFRLYPNERQKEVLTSILRLCCNLYNAALEQKRDAYRLHRKNISCYDQIKQLPELKEELVEYKQIYAQVTVDVLQRLDIAYRAFFRRIKQKSKKAGPPRFKSRNRYNSFAYPQAYSHGVKLNGKRIFLSKIGHIKIKQHRAIEGKLKTVAIKKEDKQWYAILSCDSVPERKLSPNNKQIGIDLGLTHFVTLSDGIKVKNPRHFKQSQDKLKQAQQALSKKKRNTKAKQEVAKIHNKIHNQRVDFLHKLSRQLVNGYGFIAIEDLNTQQLLQLNNQPYKQQNTNLHRSIADASWSTFIKFLVYKAEEAGRVIVKVPARGTTKTCSKCGFMGKKLELSQRTFVCKKCGFRLDRDLNAANNVLRLGQSLVA